MVLLFFTELGSPNTELVIINAFNSFH